jgi:ribonuclease Z
MNGQSDLLVDCGGISHHKFLAAKIDNNKLKYLVVTHFHPDHSSGVPLLINSLCLAGRKESLIILGLPIVIQKVRSLLQVLEYKTWPGLFPLIFQEIEPLCGKEVINSEVFTLSACPTDHVIPSIAVKYTSHHAKKTVVYSSDTRPCMNLTKFAAGVNIFIRECNYLNESEEEAYQFGHSTTKQVGEEARECGVKDLFLVHHGCDSKEELETMRGEIGTGSYRVHIPDDLSSFEL